MTFNLNKKAYRKFFRAFVLCPVYFSAVLLVIFPLVSSAAYTIDQVDVSGVTQKDFVVGPGKLELELEPGQTKTVLITVANRMGNTRTFNLEVEDFTGSRNPAETVVLLGAERGPYSLKDFLKFEKSSFELKNGERATIPVRVSLPTDAEPGGRYGSVLVSTTAKEATSAQRSAIVSRLGVLFFVKTPGEVNEDGVLKKFSTRGDQSFFGSGPVTFELLYENNGSVYLNPYGEIRIRNIIGQEVGSVEVDPWFAMPQSLRLREITWDRPYLIGRYTATALINRGYGDTVDEQTISFWVLPWKLLGTAFVGILVIVFLLRFVFSRFEFKRK
jgi:hypothetical protein